MNFFELKDLRKKLLLVNAIAIKDKATGYYGYALQFGLPLFILYAVLLRRLWLVEDQVMIACVLGAIIFYLGTHVVLKQLAKKARRKYPKEVKLFSKGPERTRIGKVYWAYLLIYYAFAAVVVVLTY